MSDHSAAANPNTEPAKSAMTLAGLAYGFPERLASYLQDTRLATAGKWVPTWVPRHAGRAYFAFVAANRQANQYAVAIRGTNPSVTAGFLHDVFDDLDVAFTAPWDPDQEAAHISRGASHGLSAVLALTAHDQTLLQHLDATLPNGANLWVTGHSLGGCLASVLALKLAIRYGPRDVRVDLMTFAAPSAGNAAFARSLQDSLPTAHRYYNTRDVVPMAWHDLDKLQSMYSPGPRCPAVLSSWAALAAQTTKQHAYTQPEPGIPLSPPRSIARAAKGLLGILSPLRERAFFIEAAFQHDPNTYLDLLDAPRLPFTLPLPWLTRELGFAGLIESLRD